VTTTLIPRSFSRPRQGRPAAPPGAAGGGSVFPLRGLSPASLRHSLPSCALADAPPPARGPPPIPSTGHMDRHRYSDASSSLPTVGGLPGTRRPISISSSSTRRSSATPPLLHQAPPHGREPQAGQPCLDAPQPSHHQGTGRGALVPSTRDQREFPPYANNKTGFTWWPPSEGTANQLAAGGNGSR